MRVCILFCLEPRTSLNTQITRSSLRAYRALILACYNNPPFIHQVWSVKLFFISEASPDMCLHNNVHNSKGNKHAAEMESCYSAITNGKFPNPDIAYRKTPYTHYRYHCGRSCKRTKCNYFNVFTYKFKFSLICRLL